jgi:hypothetical protein
MKSPSEREPSTAFTFENWKSWRELRDALRQEDEAAVFHFLYPVAMGDTTNKYNYIARRLLLHLNPQCQLSCDDAIKCLWNGWNTNDGEVPFYLYKQFGLAEMYNAAKRVSDENLTQSQHGIIDILLIWSNLASRQWINIPDDTLGLEE